MHIKSTHKVVEKFLPRPQQLVWQSNMPRNQENLVPAYVVESTFQICRKSSIVHVHLNHQLDLCLQHHPYFGGFSLW